MSNDNKVYKYTNTSWLPNILKGKSAIYVLLALTQGQSDWKWNYCFQTGYGLGLVLGLNSPFTSHDTTNI